MKMRIHFSTGALKFPMDIVIKNITSEITICCEQQREITLGNN